MVEACWRTELQGWELVAYAQNLAASKFTYSRLNTWDSPSRAWEELENNIILPLDLTPQVVLQRIQRLGDLFAPALQADQRLP